MVPKGGLVGSDFRNSLRLSSLPRNCLPADELRFVSLLLLILFSLSGALL
jgi:hypothetical protein